MGIGNIGWSEFLIIALFVLVFFGPRRLPEIASAIGRSLREFRKALNEVRDEISQASQTPETGSRPGASHTQSAAHPPMGPVGPVAAAGQEAVAGEEEKERRSGPSEEDREPESPDAQDTGTTDAHTRDTDEREG